MCGGTGVRGGKEFYRQGFEGYCFLVIFFIFVFLGGCVNLKCICLDKVIIVIIFIWVCKGGGQGCFQYLWREGWEVEVERKVIIVSGCKNEYFFFSVLLSILKF